ncbi:hypothetical protein [Kiloniella sp. b19]|uniref:hypothetical protein n=1 Tax=Kiloniella sp. GXU_MW_B19 TaxID=3141326 RepID=UPI0031DC0207
MYRDNTLVPSEAMRLLALGFLKEGHLDYATLAEKTRQFTLRIVGPSLDLIGTPLEVLKIEGLVESNPAFAAQESLVLTSRGSGEFERLIASSLRAPLNDMSKLVLSIKMRFLHLAAPKTRLEQYLLLVDIYDRQLERLQALKVQEKDQSAEDFEAWLDIEITQTQELLRRYEELSLDAEAQAQLNS